MSDFSSNPFADPEDVNPFAVSLPVNYGRCLRSLQDPAITSVTGPPPTEEYNPFADQPAPPPEVCIAWEYKLMTLYSVQYFIYSGRVISNYIQCRLPYSLSMLVVRIRGLDFCRTFCLELLV